MAFGFDIRAKPNGLHEDIIVIITILLFTRPQQFQSLNVLIPKENNDSKNILVKCKI